MHTETAFCLLSLPRPSAAPADDTGADILFERLNPEYKQQVMGRHPVACHNKFPEFVRFRKSHPCHLCFFGVITQCN